jgi:hypothetical protein
MPGPASEMAADFTTTLPRAGWRNGDSGIAHQTGPILDRLLFEHRDQTAAPDVLRVALPDGKLVEPRLVESALVFVKVANFIQGTEMPILDLCTRCSVYCVY